MLTGKGESILKGLTRDSPFYLSCLLSPPLRFGRSDRQAFQVGDLCDVGLPVLLKQ